MHIGIPPCSKLPQLIHQEDWEVCLLFSWPLAGYLIRDNCGSLTKKTWPKTFSCELEYKILAWIWFTHLTCSIKHWSSSKTKFGGWLVKISSSWVFPRRKETGVIDWAGKCSEKHVTTWASWINMYQRMSHYWWKTRELRTMSYWIWWIGKPEE